MSHDHHDDDVAWYTVVLLVILLLFCYLLCLWCPYAPGNWWEDHSRRMHEALEQTQSDAKTESAAAPNDALRL